MDSPFALGSSKVLPVAMEPSMLIEEVAAFSVSVLAQKTRL